MTNPSLARASTLAGRLAPLRPKAALAVAGAVLAMAAGCAWLGAASARTAMARDDAARIDAAMTAGFTDEALAAAAGGLDPSALAIARRHDPYTIAGAAQRDRHAEFVTARLEQLKAGDAPVAAGPFQLAGTLDASRDVECLAQAAYYEARGEGREGMRAVAQVVLNRVRSPAFPKTVCGVVFQGAGRRSGCQFSFTCDGSMRGGVNRAAWNRARDVASAALSGQVYAAVGTATHFHTTGVAPGWRNALVRVNQVGDHVFYRLGGRGGAQGRFTYAADRTAAAPESPALVQASASPAESGVVSYAALVAEESEVASAPVATAPDAAAESDEATIS